MMIFEKRGTVVLLDPESADERDWLVERREGTWFDGMLVVDPPHALPLSDDARAVGYRLHRRAEAGELCRC